MRINSAIIATVVVLSGCASMQDWIPVRVDANQSHAITTIQQATRNFDCSQNVAAQAQELAQKLQWFQIYAESKPTRDVLKPVAIMQQTVQELVERSKKQAVTPVYCDIKKRIVIQQANIIAHTVHGRMF